MFPFHHILANGREYAIECPGFCGFLPNNSWNYQSQLEVPGTSSADDEQHLFGDSIEERAIELIFANCKPCPWGLRSGHRSVCQGCNSPLNSYDYLFLAFHAFIPFFVNSTAIGYYTSKLKPNQRRFLWLLLQTLFSIFESSLALIFSLLLFSPMWQLRTFGCQKDGTLREWYSMLNNPMLGYNRQLRCSSELVFPLFSLPFVLYAFNLANLLFFRTLLYALAALSNGRQNLLPTSPFYSALWAMPLLALGHAFLSGLLYVLFPYLALFASLILLVVHLSAQSSPQQQPSGRSGPGVCAMARRVFCCFHSGGHFTATSTGGGPALLLALFIHLVLFAFSLLSLAVSSTPNGQLGELFDSNRLAMLIGIPLVLPVPLLFFILTVRLTAPNSLNCTRPNR